jgi:hypothetical protein
LPNEREAAHRLARRLLRSKGVSAIVARRRHDECSKLAAHVLRMRVDLDSHGCRDVIGYRREYLDPVTSASIHRRNTLLIRRFDATATGSSGETSLKIFAQKCSGAGRKSRPCRAVRCPDLAAHLRTACGETSDAPRVRARRRPHALTQPSAEAFVAPASPARAVPNAGSDRAGSFAGSLVERVERTPASFLRSHDRARLATEARKRLLVVAHARDRSAPRV